MSSRATSLRPRASHLVLIAATIVVAGSVLLFLPSSLGAPASGTASRSASSTPATSPSYWSNVTGSVGLAPWNRSITQAGYSPALNATILFGGYNGYGTNIPIGDTWMYQGGTWTELSAAGGPSARWGAALVYDPIDRALVMFGGRNVTAFFNDTWTYNATGWHQVNTTSAPSPRYDYGMVYDPALKAILLYGGARGNDPAGSFSPFVYFHDTWAYQNGSWTNLTAVAGTPPPAGRLIRGQMAYDTADGYAVLTGGYQYTVDESGCGVAAFNSSWAETWTYGPGGWSAAAVSGAAPPSGVGAVWYDSESGQVLEYIGMENGGSGSCPVPAYQVWSYQAGTWTELVNSSAGAPSGRILPMVVDDTGDQQQIFFGGQRVIGFWVGHYLADTWVFYPGGNAPANSTPPGSSPVTVKESGLPSSVVWGVRFSDYTLNATYAAGPRTEVRHDEPDGVDGFAVRPVAGYGVARVTSASGHGYASVDVRGRTALTVHFGRLVTVQFSLATTGREVALPSGASWSVTLVPRGTGENPEIYTAAATAPRSIDFTLPAGTEYTFSVHGPNGYAPVHPHGLLTVPAHSADRPVKFRLAGGATPTPAGDAGAPTPPSAARRSV